MLDLGGLGGPPEGVEAEVVAVGHEPESNVRAECRDAGGGQSAGGGVLRAVERNDRLERAGDAARLA